jgi:hypothetical protein
MVAVSLPTSSSNGLDETRLNLRIGASIVGISLAPASLVRQPGEQILRTLLSA